VLRIPVEIWPGGDKARARAVAIANVANVSDLAEVSDYPVSVTEGHNPLTNTPAWSQRGHLFQHDRITSVAEVAAWATEEAGKPKQ